MKKISLFLFLLFLLVYLHKAIADDVSDKTDGSFSGDNSSFVGEDVKKQTDSDFVGENTIADQNKEFLGNDFDQQVKDGKDAPFAGDGAFVGNNYGQ